MSKILVDKMPDEPCGCPFAFTKEYVPDSKTENSHYIYGCRLKKDDSYIDNDTCTLGLTINGLCCDYLDEFRWLHCPQF